MENEEINDGEVKFILDTVSLMPLRCASFLRTSYHTEVPNIKIFRSEIRKRGLSIKTSTLYQNVQLQASETLNCLFIVIILITLVPRPYLSLHSTNPQNLNPCALFSTAQSLSLDVLGGQREEAICC